MDPYSCQMEQVEPSVPDPPSEPILDDDGSAYWTPAQAAALLGETRKRIDGMVASGTLGSTKDPHLLKMLPGRGRRPNYLVLARDVEAARERLLDRLGVKTAIDSLREEVKEVRDAWERDLISARHRADQAERKLELVLAATRSRLDASIASLQADRDSLELLGGTSRDE